MRHAPTVTLTSPGAQANLETVALSTNPRFMELIERSRARVRAGGGIPIEEMRRRFS